ncbi:hypothetical protein Tco_0210168 [Tanacetum coccineum]
MTTTHSGMTLEAIEELVNQRVEEALAAYEATRAASALEDENQSQMRMVEVVEMEMAEMEMVEIEIQMRMVEMVPEEEDRVEKFIGGLPDNIQGNVIVSEPTKLQDAVQIANNLMDQKLKGYAVKNAENKRRLECKLHHEGPCTVRCGKCNKIGHFVRNSELLLLVLIYYCWFRVDVAAKD